MGMAWSNRRTFREERGRSSGASRGGLFVDRGRDLRGLEVLAPRRAAAAVPDARLHVVRGGHRLGRRRALVRRSKAAAAVAALGIVGLNAIGLVPWLQARAHAQERDRTFLETLARPGRAHGVRRASGSARSTRSSPTARSSSPASWGRTCPGCTRGRPGWFGDRTGRPGRRPRPRRRRSRRASRALGSTFERTDSIGQAVYHDLSRRVSLEEVAGFDVESAPRRRRGEPDPTE